MSTKRFTHIRNLAAAILLSWLAGVAMVTIYLFLYAAEDFSLFDLIPFALILLVFGTLLSIGASFIFRLLQNRLKRVPPIGFPALSVAVITLPVIVFSGLRSLVFRLHCVAICRHYGLNIILRRIMRPTLTPNILT